MPQDNLVVGPIPIPCTGTMSWGMSFDSINQCGGPEIYGWAEFGQNYTKNVSVGCGSRVVALGLWL